MTSTIQQEQITVTCQDGVQLNGRLLIPDHPKAVVQFNGGTAAKKEYYQPFLEYLCADGFICCLWDYRGSGDSAPKNLKDCNYHFRDYGLQDIPAVKQYLRDRFPEYPFLIVGHSVGGQQLGWIEDLSDIRGFLGFAVSVGYLNYMPWSYRPTAYYFFYMFTPFSILFSGYLAAKRFGIMEDLPRNVVREWRDWCARPNYFFDERFYGKTIPIGKFDAYTFPIHVYWASDDPISNEHSVQQFWKNIKSDKSIRIQKITPEEYGVKKIDHLGFFRKSLEPTLWEEARTKLNAFLY